MPKLRRFVLTLKEARPPAPQDLAQVEKSGSVQILDQVGRILKVEAPEQDAAQLSKKLPSWNVQPEIEYQVPDTRRLIEPEG